MKKKSVERETTNKKKGSPTKKNTARESKTRTGKEQGIRATSGKNKKNIKQEARNKEASRK